jgi:acylphosphatase
LALAGWVNNSLAGVFIEVESEKAKLEAFLSRLEVEKPPGVSSRAWRLPGWMRWVIPVLQSAIVNKGAQKLHW